MSVKAAKQIGTELRIVTPRLGRWGFKSTMMRLEAGKT
jgi:hypothetical protein